MTILALAFLIHVVFLLILIPLALKLLGIAFFLLLIAGALAAALLNLELKGMVKAMPGKTYVRTEAALKG